MYSPFNQAASSSSPAAVPNTITAVYWLCLRGSRGTRNTWTESLNLRKTPLSFPETGGLDVFISTSTPWPKGNHLRMENNVLEVSKMCLYSVWNTHTGTKKPMLWTGSNIKHCIFIKREGDTVMDSFVYQMLSINFTVMGEKTAQPRIQPLLHNALLHVFSFSIKHSRCNPWQTCQNGSNTDIKRVSIIPSTMLL